MKDKLKVIAAFIAAQKEFPEIVRDAKGSDGARTYAYTRLDHIFDTIKPILLKNGIIIVQNFDRDAGDNGLYGLTTYIIHETGEYLEYRFIPPQQMLSTNQRGIQEAGSLFSYLKRYHLCALLAIEGKNEDDDGKKFKQNNNRPDKPYVAKLPKHKHWNKIVANFKDKPKVVEALKRLPITSYADLVRNKKIPDFDEIEQNPGP